MSISESEALHRRAIIVDGHCDTPYRLLRHNVHLDEHDPEAQADLRSLQESGITASFFAAYATSLEIRARIWPIATASFPLIRARNKPGIAIAATIPMMKTRTNMLTTTTAITTATEPLVSTFFTAIASVGLRLPLGLPEKMILMPGLKR